MENELLNKMIEMAKNSALNNNCCKHSNFTVGTALLTSDNELYAGFNIENDGIQSICGERVAFCNALVHEKKDFKAIMVVGKKIENEKFIKTTPCGYCRQFMSEYVNSNFEIYSYDEENNKLYKYTIKDLLPETFESKGEF